MSDGPAALRVSASSRGVGVGRGRPVALGGDWRGGWEGIGEESVDLPLPLARTLISASVCATRS